MRCSAVECGAVWCGASVCVEKKNKKTFFFIFISVLLAASVKGIGVSCMRDFFQRNGVSGTKRYFPKLIASCFFLPTYRLIMLDQKGLFSSSKHIFKQF